MGEGLLGVAEGETSAVNGRGLRGVSPGRGAMGFTVKYMVHKWRGTEDNREEGRS